MGWSEEYWNTGNTKKTPDGQTTSFGNTAPPGFGGGRLTIPPSVLSPKAPPAPVITPPKVNPQPSGVPSSVNQISAPSFVAPKVQTIRYNDLGQEIDENGNVIRDPITGLAKTDPSRVSKINFSFADMLPSRYVESVSQNIPSFGAGTYYDSELGEWIPAPLYPTNTPPSAPPAAAISAPAPAPAPQFIPSFGSNTTFDSSIGEWITKNLHAPKPPVMPIAPEEPISANDIPYQPTEIPYATWENIQPYFNPYNDFLVNQGTKAIENSAAARGMLSSSGTIQSIGDWATSAGAKAYDSAVQNFMADRLGVSNIFQDSRDFDWQNYIYNNNLDYLTYSDELSSYNKSLKDYYDMLSGLSKTGQDAANNAGNITGDSATAMANLFMALAQMQSMGGVASASNQSGFMGDLFKMIPSLMEMSKQGGG